MKLQKFGENLDLRIRPHVLLKVLQDLRIWELCSPDIAVAIEVTTTSLPLHSVSDVLIQSPLNTQALFKCWGHKGPCIYGAHFLIGEGLSHYLVAQLQL